MEVTKAQIAKGVAGFIFEDMMPHVDDKGMQFVMGVFAGSLEANPKALDNLLSNSFFSMAAQSGNNYDLSILKQSVANAIDKCGKLEITIPGIKFISPEDKVFQFNKEDINRLVSRIEGR